MRTLLLIPGLVWCFGSPAQHPVIQGILDAMRIDSTMWYVEQLTGEVPVDVGNGPETIVSRHQVQPGNVLAQKWLAQELERHGYTVELDTFSSNGINVLAWKTGALYPDSAVIICAHYDSAPAGLNGAPGADDDGSGCGAVLEAARLLRHIDFEHSILFAFWDNEEQGLLGSKAFAQNAAANDVAFRGVVNMDAIAYDGNADKKARVHTRPIANSFEIADTVFAVLGHYDIDIDLILTNPGATYSDHASFWNNGYGAVLIIEEFGADGNPYYHTPNDKIEHFDVPYYEKLIKLSIATVATLAVPAQPASIAKAPAEARATLRVDPNPVQGDGEAWLQVAATGQHRVELVDANGALITLLHDGPLAVGRHRFELPLAHAADGVYFLRVAPAHGQPTSARVVKTGR